MALSHVSAEGTVLMWHRLLSWEGTEEEESKLNHTVMLKASAHNGLHHITSTRMSLKVNPVASLTRRQGRVLTGKEA